MNTYHDALQAILNCTPRLDKERVDLSDAAGRTLCEDLVASHPLPLFDQCTRDGYALASARSHGARLDAPVTLKVAGEASAGAPFEGVVREDRAVRVTTGSVLPLGLDAVVSGRRVEVEGGAIRLTEEVRPGEGVRRTGEDVAEGDVAVEAGSVLQPFHLGLLAALGVTRPRVVRRPQVRILATGNELVDPGDEPLEGQIRLSSSSALAALVRGAGGIAKLCGIVPDKRKQLRKRIKEHLAGDVLLTTGGVSSGPYDLVPQALADLGAEILVHGVHIRPGSPVLVACHKGTVIFGLPGNPASTVVAFLALVRPALWKMLGRTESVPRRIVATLEHEYSKQDDRRQFVFAHWTPSEGRCLVSVRKKQDAGYHSTLASANCLMVIPEHVTRLLPGDPVEIEFL